jgi:transposase
MPKPYSEDLRRRVAEVVEAGNSVRAVALQYSVSPAFICRMHALWCETGAVQGKPFGGYRRSRMKPYEAVIRTHLANSPSMPLKELQSWLEQEQALSISISAIDKFIRHKLGYRYKKTLVASEQQREDVVRAREQ